MCLLSFAFQPCLALHSRWDLGFGAFLTKASISIYFHHHAVNMGLKDLGATFGVIVAMTGTPFDMKFVVLVHPYLQGCPDLPNFQSSGSDYCRLIILRHFFFGASFWKIWQISRHSSTKGQLIWKDLFSYPQFLQKWTKLFAKKNTNSFVQYLEKFDNSESPFEN